MNKDSEQYYASHKRFPRTSLESNARIGKMSALAKSFNDAVSEMIQEQNQDKEAINNSGNTRTHTPSVDSDQEGREVEDTNENKNGNHLSDDPKISAIIDEQFKHKILNKFGAATSNAFSSEGIKTVNDYTAHMYTTYSSARASKSKSKSEIVEPPAGILHGKVKYYNRFHGQWRILVSDAEIRPRVNIDFAKLKKRDKVSLRTSSRLSLTKEIQMRRKRGRMNVNVNVSSNAGAEAEAGADANSNSNLPTMNDDGCVKINGDLMILAYDDKL